MNYELKDCIDAGTEFCPCHLAETGDCILCSQLSGKAFCDCANWKGVCIYQEFIWNGSKAKAGRKNYLCNILKKELIEDNLLILTIKTSHKLAIDLSKVGSYIFIRNPKTEQFYDAPISIMDSDISEDCIKVGIEIKGIKTKSIALLEEGNGILIRGPFWNGDLGLKNIYNSKNSTCIIVARGIGQAPMLPVMKKLHANGNKIIVIMDKAPYKEIFIEDYLKQCNAEVIECNTLENGSLSEEAKIVIQSILNKENVSLVHCSAADILIFSIIEFIDDRVKTSCCNNAKMCCGEGICGTCTARFRGHRVKKMCKFQIEPKYVFEGRRLI